MRFSRPIVILLLASLTHATLRRINPSIKSKYKIINGRRFKPMSSPSSPYQIQESPVEETDTWELPAIPGAWPSSKSKGGNLKIIWVHKMRPNLEERRAMPGAWSESESSDSLESAMQKPHLYPNTEMNQYDYRSSELRLPFPYDDEEPTLESSEQLAPEKTDQPIPEIFDQPIPEKIDQPVDEKSSVAADSKRYKRKWYRKPV